MRNRVWVTLAVFMLLLPGIARADQVQFFVAGTAFTGVHKDPDATLKNGYVVALPSFAVRDRRKNWEIFAEDVPDIGPIRYNSFYGPRKITVGYGDATLRYWFSGEHFAVGVGDSLYVRKNDYLDGAYNGIRSAGTRFEVLGATRLTRDLQLVARLGLAPSMHQRFSNWTDYPTRIRPEYGTASVVDGSLQLEQRRGGGHTWVWGVRYLNYAGGNFDPLYDYEQERTGIISAFAAWGFSLGH